MGNEPMNMLLGMVKLIGEPLLGKVRQMGNEPMNPSSGQGETHGK